MIKIGPIWSPKWSKEIDLCCLPKMKKVGSLTICPMTAQSGPGGRSRALDHAPRKLPKLKLFLPGYQCVLPGYQFFLPGIQFVLPEYQFFLPGYQFVLPKYKFVLPKYQFCLIKSRLISSMSSTLRDLGQTPACLVPKWSDFWSQK